MNNLNVRKRKCLSHHWSYVSVIVSAILFGAVLSFVLLRKIFTLIQLVAGVVMLLGIYVLYRCGERIK